MRIYYFLLAFSLFVQTPEADLLTATDRQEISREHGSVFIIQGRQYVHVGVRGSAYTLEVFRLNGEQEQVSTNSGAGREVFHFLTSELGTGAYLARATFADEVIESPFFILR